MIHAPFYAEHTQLAPAFLRDDAKKLREFIKTHVKHGDDGETMYLIREALSGTSEPTEQEIANLLPQELLKMAKEWRKKPEKVIAALSWKSAK